MDKIHEKNPRILKGGKKKGLARSHGIQRPMKQEVLYLLFYFIWLLICPSLRFRKVHNLKTHGSTDKKVPRKVCFFSDKRPRKGPHRRAKTFWPFLLYFRHIHKKAAPPPPPSGTVAQNCCNHVASVENVGGVVFHLHPGNTRESQLLHNQSQGRTMARRELEKWIFKICVLNPSSERGRAGMNR